MGDQQQDLGPTPTPRAGQCVVVVGGGGAMGLRTTELLARMGCRVVVFDTPTTLGATSFPAGVDVHPIDLADADSVALAFEWLSGRHAAIDGLVNFAGFTMGSDRVTEMSIDAWDAVQSVNLRGAFLVAQRALPLLQASGRGSMVLLSSVLGIETMPGYAHYGAAKAGLISLTRVLARENAPTVRVNALAPGAVHTPFLTGGTGRQVEAQRLDPELYARMVPMGRMAEVDDVVGPLMFLLSEASGYITGQTILVDGGMVPR